MMNRNIYYLSLWIFFSCLPSASGAKEPELNISVLDTFKPGVMTKAEIIKSLGSPEGGNAKEENWEYSSNGHTRLKISYDRISNVVGSMTWYVREGDAERPLRKAMDKFSGSKWHPDTVEWISPHSYPDQCFLKDDSRGIEIEYTIETQKVVSIRRWDPSRKLAKLEPHKQAPKVCIDSRCVNAMSSKEFAEKTSLDEYCKVPH